MLAVGALSGLFLVILIVGITLRVIFLINMMNLLKKVAASRRTLEPGLVWLQIIPIFAYIWNFVMVTRIADSVGAEIQARGMYGDDKPGFGVGLGMSICAVVGALGSFGNAMGLLSISLLAWVAYLLLWIIYWVQMSQYSSRMGSAFYNPDAPLDAHAQQHAGFDTGNAAHRPQLTSTPPPPQRGPSDYNDGEDF